MARRRELSRFFDQTAALSDLAALPALRHPAVRVPSPRAGGTFEEPLDCHPDRKIDEYLDYSRLSDVGDGLSRNLHAEGIEKNYASPLTAMVAHYAIPCLCSHGTI